MVTHPSTNWAQCRLTSLIETNVLHYYHQCIGHNVAGTVLCLLNSGGDCVWNVQIVQRELPLLSRTRSPAHQPPPALQSRDALPPAPHDDTDGPGGTRIVWRRRSDGSEQKTP